jgi:hypothetical protein
VRLLLLVALFAAAGLLAVLTLDADRAVQPAGAIGLTNRQAVQAIPAGANAAFVRTKLGRPRSVEAAPLQPNRLVCWIYGRRSGRPGVYRLCFRGGALEAVVRPGG